MKLFIYNLSDGCLFSWIFICLVASGLVGLFVIIKVDSKRHIADNEAVGYIAGIVGIIYAILLGFVVLYAMNYFQAAQEVVEHEADILTLLYRDTQLIEAPSQKMQMDSLLQQYLNNVIKLEWPAMGKIQTDRTNDHVINQMSSLLRNYTSGSSKQQDLKYDLFNQVGQLSDVRERRFHIATATMITNTEWYSIIVTTFLTLFMSLFFVMRLYLHIIMIFMLSIASAILITLIVSIDAPFAGRATLLPTALEQVKNI